MPVESRFTAATVGALYERTFFLEWRNPRTHDRQMQLFAVHQVGVSPSPSGREWRGAPGEGENAEMSRHTRPHPALRATFSRREKDTPAVFR